MDASVVTTPPIKTVGTVETVETVETVDPVVPKPAASAAASARVERAPAATMAPAHAAERTKATTTHGVLIVHGIGNQRQSDILLDIGEPLYDWLSCWYAARALSPWLEPRHVRWTKRLRYFLLEKVVRLKRARRVRERAFRLRAHRPQPGAHALPALRRTVLNFDPVERGEADGHAYAALGLPDGDRWVLAEAWWAASVRRQSFARMLGWSLKHLYRAARSLVFGAWERLIGEGNDPASPGEKLERKGARTPQGQPAPTPEPQPRTNWATVYRHSLAIYYQLMLLIFALALVVGSPFLLIVVLLAQVPFSPLRNALYRVVGTFLEVNLGEFRTIFEDEIQSANMRRRLAEAVVALVRQHGCDDVTIVAHSGGAVVSFDMLTDPRHAGPARRVRKLITVGSGLNKAWLIAPDLRRLHGPLPGHIHWVDIWATMDPAPSDPVQFPSDPARPGRLIEVFQPNKEVQAAQHLEKRATASKVARRRTPPQPEDIFWPESVRCTNELSVVTDHWIYWENDEEALARIVAEIDRPFYRDSPFWRGDHPLAGDAAARDREAKLDAMSAPVEAPQRIGIQRRRERVIQLACARMIALACWAFLEGLLAGRLAEWLQLHQDPVLPLPRSLVSLLGTIDGWLAWLLGWTRPWGDWIAARPLLVALEIVAAVIGVALVTTLLFIILGRINVAIERNKEAAKHEAAPTGRRGFVTWKEWPRHMPWYFAGLALLWIGVPWLGIFVPLLAPRPVFWTIAAFLLGVPVLGGLNAYRFYWSRRDARERKAFITSVARNGQGA